MDADGRSVDGIVALQLDCSRLWKRERDVSALYKRSLLQWTCKDAVAFRSLHSNSGNVGLDATKTMKTNVFGERKA